jgi:hypothetical protein
MEKTCSICKITKDISNFNKNSYRKNGYRTECKDCRKLKTKKYRDLNKDKLNSYNKLYQEKVKNNEIIKNEPLTKFERSKKNSDYTTMYIKNRIEVDSLFKLKTRIRQLLSNSIRGKGYTKKSKSSDILGISFDDFKNYIESLFIDGMSWDNYGEWHLDHKIPISWAKSEQEVYELNHYSNFQPLWADDNLLKGNRFKN